MCSLGMMLKIGLTGGIGTGKTTTLELFRENGAQIQSADAFVHELLENDRDVIAKVTDLLGSRVQDDQGKLDRQYIASKVFSDVHLRLALESIIHPIVQTAMDEWLREQVGDGIAVAEIPLLFETHNEAMFDATVVVIAEQEIQLNRLLNKGLKLEDAQRRMAAQWPLAEKARRATYIIHNDGSLLELAQEVERVWVILQTLCG